MKSLVKAADLVGKFGRPPGCFELVVDVTDLNFAVLVTAALGGNIPYCCY